MATREVQMLQQMLDPNQQDPSPTEVQGVGSEDFNPTEAAGGTSFQRGEQELTEDMRNNMPVVNRAREQNRMSGISNFLNNPEVQNALLQFGRAFTGNREGEPGTVLANAGEQMIQGQANQRALEAFERGEDPAQAAGRFADPELISRLQQQQQQADQFQQEIELAEERVDINRTQLQTDTAYKFAKLGQDRALTKRQMELKESEAELQENLIEARTELIEAQTQAVGQGQSDPSQLAEVRTNYLNTLQQQERNYQDQIDVAQNILDEVDSWWVNEEWIKKQAQRQGINVPTNEEGDIDRDAIKEDIESHIGTLQSNLNTIGTQRQNIEKAQEQTLTGQGGDNNNGDTEDGNTPETQGSPDSPVEGDFTMQDLRSMAPGSYATSSLTGETYVIGSDGEPRIYNPNEDEEE